MLVSRLAHRLFLVASVVVAAIVSSDPAHAQPSGWLKRHSATGVATYQKGTETTYVTVANLPTVRILSLTGTVSGAPNGTVTKKALNEYWNSAVAANTSTSKAFAVFNGTFFDPNRNPTTISFGLKKSGTIISYGSDLSNTAPWNRTFAFTNSSSTATISSYARATYDNAALPDVVGGLDVSTPATKFPPAGLATSRTFLGLDGRFLFVYTSQRAILPATAIADLNAWGASGKIMLDGGGSTGLIVNGERKLWTNRPLPHTIAIYAGK